MDDEPAFLEAIQNDPDDDTARLVYADWLDECGDPKGEYLRVEAELRSCSPKEPQFEKLRTRLKALMFAVGDRVWISQVARSRISVCERNLNIRFRCPNRWSELQPTDHPTIHYCGDCRQSVFFCESVDEALYHAEHGRCVALDASKPAETDELLKKQFDVKRDLTPAVPNDSDKVDQDDEWSFTMGIIDPGRVSLSDALPVDKRRRFAHREEVADRWVAENIESEFHG